MLDLTLDAYERWLTLARTMDPPSPLDTWMQAADQADAWALDVAFDLLQECPGKWPDTQGHFDRFLTPVPAWNRLLRWKVEGSADPLQATLVLPSGRTIMDYRELKAMRHYLVDIAGAHRG